MKEVQDIHLENLREALKHYDTYLRLAIATSFTYAAISFAGLSKSPGPTNIPFLPAALPVSYQTLAFLAWGAQLILALLAASTLDAVFRALVVLAADQQVLKAACGYPSLATLKVRWMRLTAVFASPFLLALATFVGNLEATRDPIILLLLSHLLITVPYFIIAHILWTPLDEPRRKEYASLESDSAKQSVDTGAA